MTLSSYRKYPYSPHRKDWNFLGGWGLCKAKKLKKCLKEWGGLRKNPFLGRGMDIFWNFPLHLIPCYQGNCFISFFISQRHFTQRLTLSFVGVCSLLTYVKYYAGDYDTAVFHLGFVASGFTIAVYGSPLATVVSNISNTSDGVSLGYPNTKKRVENMTHSGVFLTKFEVFG